MEIAPKPRRWRSSDHLGRPLEGASMKWILAPGMSFFIRLRNSIKLPAIASSIRCPSRSRCGATRRSGLGHRWRSSLTYAFACTAAFPLLQRRRGMEGGAQHRSRL
jgi:hypothetical protein